MFLFYKMHFIVCEDAQSFNKFREGLLGHSVRMQKYCANNPDVSQYILQVSVLIENDRPGSTPARNRENLFQTELINELPT